MKELFNEYLSIEREKEKRKERTKEKMGEKECGGSYLVA